MANKVELKKYHFLYKTTNLLNGKVYYGIHSTNNLDDGYLGSGCYFYRSIKKYGKENFQREILEFFDCREDLSNAEKNLITEDFVKDPNCYNVQMGGEGWNSLNTIPIVDKNGNYFRVHKEDPRYLSGELVHNLTGNVVVKDIVGNYFVVKCDDPRYLSGELVPFNKGIINVKDHTGKNIKVKIDDPRYLSGELVGISKGKVTVKNEEDETFNVDINDPRYLSGELVPIWTGRKHKEETKRKIGEANSIKQKGEHNSQYGTMWITNGVENKKIKKDETIPEGWSKGRIQNKNKN